MTARRYMCCTFSCERALFNPCDCLLDCLPLPQLFEFLDDAVDFSEDFVGGCGCNQTGSTLRTIAVAHRCRRRR